METGKIVWSPDFKTEKKGTHKFLNEKMGQVTTQYHLIVQERIIKELSTAQLKKIIKIAQAELKARPAEKGE